MVSLSSTCTCAALRDFFSIRYWIAAKMLVDLCLFFIGLIGWDDYIVEGKEAPDDEQCSD